VGREYSIGNGYKLASMVILALTPFMFYKFFADLTNSERRAAILKGLGAHPFAVTILVLIPVLVVFAGLVVITIRFATDVFFKKRVEGVLESRNVIKTRFVGDRIRVRVSGREFDLLNDIGVAELLLAENSPGRSIEMTLGGLNKVLYLRIE
jgi:hypothetical protein